MLGNMADNDAKGAASLEDLIVPVIPSMITSIVLNAVTDLSGGAKIGAAAALAVVLWWLVRGRRGGRQQARARELVRKYWRWGLLALGTLAVLALLVTVLVFDRPSANTVGLAVSAFVVAAVIAYRDRPLPGALAAAISGGVVGLCLGIALG